MVKHKRNGYIRIIFFCLIFCLVISCGTLGSIGDTIFFPTSKKKLEIAIDSLYAKHPEYKIPEKWEPFNDWSKLGYDFLESRIFYFKSEPEEMYYVAFYGDSTILADTTKVGIGIRAMYNGDYRGRWLLGDSLSFKEKQRIKARFDREIVSKLEEYTKTKVTKQSPYQ